MNLHKTSCANLAAVALVFIVPLAGSALGLTQTGPNPQQPARQQTSSDAKNVQGLINGLNIGPLMMGLGGANGSMIDFTRSNERVLLERTDVRSELFIDSKQYDALSDLDAKYNQQLQQKLMQTVLQNTVNNPDFKVIAQESSSKQPNIAVIQDVLNTSFQAIQTGIQGFQTTVDSQEEAVLNPKQIKRLHELDLQWRGLLALSDKKVATDLTVTDDQKAVVDAALKAYQATQTSIFEPIMTQAMQHGLQTANGKAAPRTFDEQDMQRTISVAMESDAMVKARTTAEDKVKASLTAEQLAKWKTMIGRKFYFTRLD